MKVKYLTAIILVIFLNTHLSVNQVGYSEENSEEEWGWFAIKTQWWEKVSREAPQFVLKVDNYDAHNFTIIRIALEGVDIWEGQVIIRAYTSTILVVEDISQVNTTHSESIINEVYIEESTLEPAYTSHIHLENGTTDHIAGGFTSVWYWILHKHPTVLPSWLSEGRYVSYDSIQVRETGMLVEYEERFEIKTLEAETNSMDVIYGLTDYEDQIIQIQPYSPEIMIYLSPNQIDTSSESPTFWYRLLEYVGEEEIRGRGGRLKTYVFNTTGPYFDPETFGRGLIWVEQETGLVVQRTEIYPEPRRGVIRFEMKLKETNIIKGWGPSLLDYPLFKWVLGGLMIAVSGMTVFLIYRRRRRSRKSK
jgi:hypothetical protein